MEQMRWCNSSLNVRNIFQKLNVETIDMHTTECIPMSTRSRSSWIGRSTGLPSVYGSRFCSMRTVTRFSD